MSFPLNPLDGQKTTRNNIVYTYSAITNSWRRDFNNLLDRLTLAGNYESTATTNGTLVVYGGAGITGNLNVGGNTELFGNLTVDGQVTLSPSGSNVYIEPGNGGNVVIYPNVYGYIDNMIIGGNRPRIGYFTDLVVEDTTQSYGTDTGALTVAGGVGIGEDLWVGGVIHGTVVGTITGATTSTENIVGGAAGEVIYQSNTNTTAFTNVGTTGSVLVSYGSNQPRFQNYIGLTSTATSTSTTTGALTVVGGVGIQGNLNIGGSVTVGGVPLTNIAGGQPWQIITSNYTATNNDRLMISTTVTAVTVTLPLSPTFGSSVQFLDYGGSFGVNTATIARNNELIMGIPEDLIIDFPYAANTLIYAGIDEGWKLGALM
jgi:hypothetical protein